MAQIKIKTREEIEKLFEGDHTDIATGGWITSRGSFFNKDMLACCGTWREVIYLEGERLYTYSDNSDIHRGPFWSWDKDWVEEVVE